MATKRSYRRSVPVAESMSDSGMWVFESRHNESFLMEGTQHRFPKLLIIREGRGRVEADWPAKAVDPRNCISGDCILVPSGTRHRVIDDSRHPISLYGLAIDPGKISLCASIEQMIPFGKLPRQRMSLLKIEQRMRRLLYLVSRGDNASNLAAIAGAIEIFARLALASGGDRGANDTHPSATGGAVDIDVIDEYVIWMQSNFYEALTVESASSACGMSRRKFTNDFRQKMQQTWLGYLNQLRIDHARMLLRETDHKVTSIAFQSGFEELSTFYRTFKRIAGMKPLEYRADFH
ncbi:AraC family transcriptional regulator [Allorhodopirellula solitaria]|uniref:Melibiose operon regulatory protein n=1 Tax=Allorhodopirellula solitaria TaxID=2527987 RepID=A0A5C5YK17_9BACT|nr:AraC family transcriptional regulator [Allorhodopirellula solitaria]TWT75169.1 Melibiose operon regulatory protein [Allorhodopirellula solitaria]